MGRNSEMAVGRRKVSFKRAYPDQRSDFLDRPRVRQFTRVVSPIVQAVSSQKRDGGFKQGHAPMQRTSHHFLGMTPLFGAVAQSLDVLTSVPAHMRVIRSRGRTDQAAADVCIKRGAAHSQPLCSLL